MYVIVGLGNPGQKYTLTRHNIGFLVVDAIVSATRASNTHVVEKSEHNADTFKIGSDILLVKPKTFMNLSGESVQPLLSFYKIPLENLLVIHDEVDIPFTQLRLQKGRGHGGHNGIRNIHEKLGAEYARLKVGVGRPSIPNMSVADFVLQDFAKTEMATMPEVLQRSCDAVFAFIDDGFERAQNTFNTKNDK
jgi:PTH1 family peptidyl-tRNA hydrolase